MTGFSADWLALREPYDARARNRHVLAALAAAVERRDGLAVVDLASGAGSTLRAISSALAPRQSWRLVDHDPSLLALAAPSTSIAGATVSTVVMDLAHDFEAALDGPVELVTASALLDLVSADWLERAARAIAHRGLSFYAALTYDGRVEFEPRDPLDVAIIEAVNRHQRGDKGFGPALGPTAAAAAIARFEASGYVVVHGLSDWRLGPRDVDMQNELLAGWAAAAEELGEPGREAIAAWRGRRRELVALGRSSIRVGHADLFADRPGVRSQSNKTSPSSG